MPVFVLSDENVFPPPNLAAEEGLLAIGGDLSTERLLNAYSNGIFPWYSEGEPIMWWSPTPRMVVFPKNYRPSKNLHRTVRKGVFELRFDSAFADVVEACAQVPRFNQEGTWITPEMQEAYIKLHHEGYAHSVETYQDGKLVGGLYGVSLGKAFFGESMFHKVTDASKVAYHFLLQFALHHQFELIDAQQDTPHLRRLGGSLQIRDEFLSLLHQALRYPTLKGPWKSGYTNEKGL